MYSAVWTGVSEAGEAADPQMDFVQLLVGYQKTQALR